MHDMSRNLYMRHVNVKTFEYTYTPILLLKSIFLQVIIILQHISYVWFSKPLSISATFLLSSFSVNCIIDDGTIHKFMYVHKTHVHKIQTRVHCER